MKGNTYLAIIVYVTMLLGGMGLKENKKRELNRYPAPS